MSVQFRRATDERILRRRLRVWQITEGAICRCAPWRARSLLWLAHSPAALHKGNVTGLTLIDEKADAAQRAAFGKGFCWKSGGPWMISPP